MADLRLPRQRPSPRIYLAQSDIIDMVTQPETLASFSQDELQKIADAMLIEINFRQNGENENANS